MQVFATNKVPALGRALYQQLMRFTKHRLAVKIMKLTAIILLGACVQLSARGVGQTITLSLKDVPIQKVFREIERQTTYTFFVESELFAKAKKVTVQVNNLPLNQVLDICFKEQPFTYSISGKIITVTTRVNKSMADVKASPEQLPIDIRGRVVNSSGEPIQDATVSVQGSPKRTITNANGEFIITGVEEGAVVVITHVQYETMTLPIKGNGLVSAVLQLRISKLDELQVIAYGTTTRRFSTGNVATIKSNDIEKQPVQNPLLALQGRVTGVEVTQLTGMPGGGVTVRIQGRNSIRSGLEPLIVIDGVPFPSQLSSTGFEGIVQQGSPLNYINPADIESIDVLKDADATAIYGSRAANGAILITTKKGKAGRTKIGVNLQQGWGKVGNKLDMLNTRQYLDMRYEALKNDGIALSSLTQSGNYDLTVWDSTRNTDWQKELIGGTAKYTNINASVSGGTPLLQYLLGGTYNRQTTVFPGDFDDKKGGIHFNISGANKDQRFKVQLSGSYMLDDNHLPGVDLTQPALLLAPDAPSLYTEDGILNWSPNAAGSSTFTNPLGSVVGAEFNNTTKNLISNISLSYKILPGLEIRSSFGYTNTLSSLYLANRLETVRPESRATTQRTTFNVKRDMSSWIFEPQLQYSSKLGNGKIEGLLGGTILQNHSENLSVSGSGYSTDLLMTSLAASTSTAASSIYSESKFNGLFTRLNYIYDNKFIINLTARRDGSSKFGDANKLHNFGSVGGAYILSEEPWIRQEAKIISFAKLRVSYGITGNDQIGDFGHLSLYDLVTQGILYQGAIVLQPTRIPNPHLQWEVTRKLQTGVDLGFLNDRILIGATYARNRSSNQIIAYTLPTTTGFSTILKNFPALIQNTSWEFTLNSVNIKTKNLNWTISANLTIPRNKVVKFPGIETTSYASGSLGVIVGEQMGVKRAYHYAGVDPTSGRYMVYDLNDNLTYTPILDDKTVLLTSFTKYYGGLQNSLSYKSFQLDITLQYVRQLASKDMYYSNSYQASSPPGNFRSDGYTNQPESVFKRWQKPGDDAPIGIFTSKASGLSLWPSESDVGYSYDASFMRLKTFSLSWQLPLSWLKRMKLQNARLYFQGQNLATISNYTGLDPESKSLTTLPPLKLATVGIQLEL